MVMAPKASVAKATSHVHTLPARSLPRQPLRRVTARKAARKFVPAQQGDLDGTCGLYAVLNAIARVSGANPCELKATVRRIILRNPRYGLISYDGATNHQIRTLARNIVKSANRIGEHSVELEVPFHATQEKVTLNKWLAAIKSAISRGGVAIIGIQDGGPGYESHATVVRKVTDKNLLLDDSAGRKMIAISHLTMNPRKDDGVLVDPKTTIYVLPAE